MCDERNLKALHLAKSIEELQTLVHRDISRIQQFDKLVKGAEKLFHEGLKKEQQELDEESAYVYFLRFMRVYNNLIKKYHTRTCLIEQRLGREKITSEKHIDSLYKSLKSRYNKVYDHSIVKNDVPKISNDVISTPKINMVFADGFITSYEVYELINKNIEFVIFDARPEGEYESSNMKLDQCCNIPEEIIDSGLSAHTLEIRLPEKSKLVWWKRHNVAIIILLDWNSTKKTKLTKLTTLKDIIINWDPAYNDNVKVVILDGGYLHWWESYPMLCTNSNALHNERNELLSELIDLDVIEYPSTTLITTDIPLPLPPSFNRALKPSDVKYISDLENQENKKLQTKYPEYYDELENLKSKRKTELEELRINQPDILNHNNLSFDSISLLPPNKHYTPAEDVNTAITQAKEMIKNRSYSPETVKKIANIREQILLDARSKKKPGEEGEDAPTRKRQAIYTEYIRTIDLQQNLFGKSFSAIQNKLKNLRFPPVHVSKRPFKVFIPGVNGLKNLGNTCFMNSIVQALSNTAPLSQYFINKYYIPDLTHKSDSGTHFTTSLGEVLHALWAYDSKDPFQPHKLKKITFSLIPHFVSGCHQDAHEFFIKLVEFLHDELKNDVKPKKNTVLTPMQEAWLGHDKGKLSILNDWFLGQMRVTMTCVQCNTKRDRYEGFYNLSIDLPNDSDLCNLSDCIRNLYLPTILHGYQCPSCSHNNVTQRYRVAAYPPYLLISLSRFKLFDPISFQYTKNKIACSYPSSLELGGFKYVLYAAVYHYGEMSGGHYIAICQNYVNENWYRFDDERCEQVSQNAAINETAAYLLFYKMVD